MNILLSLLIVGHGFNTDVPRSYFNRVANPTIDLIDEGTSFGYGNLEIVDRVKYDVEDDLARGVLSTGGVSVPVAFKLSSADRGDQFSGYFFFRLAPRSSVAGVSGPRGHAGQAFDLPKRWGATSELLGAYGSQDGADRLPSSTGLDNLVSLVGLIDRGNPSASLDSWLFIDAVRGETAPECREVSKRIINALLPVRPTTSRGRLIRAMLLSTMYGRVDADPVERDRTPRFSKEVLDAIRLGTPDDRVWLNISASEGVVLSPKETTVSEILEVAQVATWARSWLIGKLMPPADPVSFAKFKELLDDEDPSVQLKVLRKLAGAVKREDLVPNMLLARGRNPSIALDPIREFWRPKSFADYLSMRK